MKTNTMLKKPNQMRQKKIYIYIKPYEPKYKIEKES